MEMSKTLAHYAIFPDTRDEKLQQRFFPYPLDQSLNHTTERSLIHQWYFDRLYYNVPQGGTDCCSDVIVQCHYIKSYTLYFLEYLIYNVHPFGLEKNLTETLPRKLGLQEIIKASDAKSYGSFIGEHEDVHDLTSSEVY